MKWMKRLRDKDGLSLVEVMVALSMFSVGMIALGQLAFVSSRSLRSGHTQMTEWSIAHEKLDSIAGLGWAALDGESGAEDVAGLQVTWQVTGTNPRVITLTVPRRSYGAARDTFVTYVAQ
jgi:prepilin-type N-terminal cleavage/methylation domain-containing protein